MLRLIRTELRKQVRRPRTWVALGFVVIVPIIIAVALKLNPPDFGGDADGRRATSSSRPRPGSSCRSPRCG